MEPVVAETRLMGNSKDAIFNKDEGWTFLEDYRSVLMKNIYLLLADMSFICVNLVYSYVHLTAALTFLIWN